MCEFCLKHGEGKKWYLQAKNYSQDLLSDAGRRGFIKHMMTHAEDARRDMRRLDVLRRAPSHLQRLVGRLITKRMKRVHFGQVLPIEDIEKIFDIVNCIVRVACYCRHVQHGEEKRYCYGISISPGGGKFVDILRGLDDSLLNGPGNAGVEELTKQEALDALREHEKEGLCHTVWTFHAPFIGGICNCNNYGCLAMHCSLDHKIPVMFRAEYVAYIDPGRCVGCKACLRVCQFDALTHSIADKKVSVRNENCYGCGICRSVCPQDAIELEDRTTVADAANLWL